MVTINDKIQIELTLMQANFLRSALVLLQSEVTDVHIKNAYSKLIDAVDKVFNSLDFTENEILVDDLNAKLRENL